MSDEIQRLQEELDRERETCRKLNHQIVRWQTAQQRFLLMMGDKVESPLDACEKLLSERDALKAEIERLNDRLDSYADFIGLTKRACEYPEHVQWSHEALMDGEPPESEPS